MKQINLPPQALTYNQRMDAEYWDKLIPKLNLSDRDYREKVLRATSGRLREFMAATTIPRPMEFYQCGRNWDKMQDLQQRKLELAHNLPEADRTSSIRVDEGRLRKLKKLKKEGYFKHIMKRENI